MAIDSFAPAFFSQALSPLEMPDYPRLALAGELPIGVGNALSWADLEGSVATHSYTDNADLTYSLMADLVYTVTITANVATSFAVTDIESNTRIASAVANGMAQSLREQRVSLETVLRSAFRNTARLKTSGLNAPTRGDADGLASNMVNLEMLHTGGSGTAHPKWGTDNGNEALVKAVQWGATFARRHFWSASPVATVPVEIYNALMDFLTFDKPNLGQGAIVDSALTGGRVPTFYGVEIVPEPLVGEFNVGGTVGANAGLRIDFHYPGMSVKYINKPLRAEVMRDPDAFRDNGRTLFLHGAGQDAARHLASVTIQLSAS